MEIQVKSNCETIIPEIIEEGKEFRSEMKGQVTDKYFVLKGELP